jgi:hypothetical protein
MQMFCQDDLLVKYWQIADKKAEKQCIDVDL